MARNARGIGPDDDQRTAPTRRHDPGKRATDVEHAVGIDRERAPPLRIAGFQHRGRRQYAGNMRGEVDRPDIGFHLRDKRIDRRRIGHIERERMGRYDAAHLGEFGRAQVGRDHRRAAGPQQVHDCRADAAGRAGDQRDPAFESCELHEGLRKGGAWTRSYAVA